MLEYTTQCDFFPKIFIIEKNIVLLYRQTKRKENKIMKLNKKQIEANLRNKLTSQYKEKTEQLKSEKAVLEKRYNEMYERARKAEIERDELKDKVAQYEDWNRRLQEFMDMSDEDRIAYVENLKRTKELDDAISRFGFYGKMLGTLFM